MQPALYCLYLGIETIVLGPIGSLLLEVTLMVTVFLSTVPRVIPLENAREESVPFLFFFLPDKNFMSVLQNAEYRRQAGSLADPFYYPFTCAMFQAGVF